jgi:hypothetical protein
MLGLMLTAPILYLPVTYLANGVAPTLSYSPHSARKELCRPLTKVTLSTI